MVNRILTRHILIFRIIYIMRCVCVDVRLIYFFFRIATHLIHWSQLISAAKVCNICFIFWFNKYVRWVSWQHENLIDSTAPSPSHIMLSISNISMNPFRGRPEIIPNMPWIRCEDFTSTTELNAVCILSHHIDTNQSVMHDAMNIHDII